VSDAKLWFARHGELQIRDTGSDKANAPTPAEITIKTKPMIINNVDMKNIKPDMNHSPYFFRTLETRQCSASEDLYVHKHLFKLPTMRFNGGPREPLL
jgi:hypothetical protein